MSEPNEQVRPTHPLLWDHYQVMRDLARKLLRERMEWQDFANEYFYSITEQEAEFQREVTAAWARYTASNQEEDAKCK